MPSVIFTVRVTFGSQLYVKRYAEVLQTTNSVEAFVRTIWELVGGGKRPNVADDGVRIC